MEAVTQKQTQWGKIARPTLQAPMTPLWTWFQTAPVTDATKVVFGEMFMHNQEASHTSVACPSVVFVCFVFSLKLALCAALYLHIR